SPPIANQTHRSAVTVDSHCSATTVLVPDVDVSEIEPEKIQWPVQHRH
ncbi:hypothetical protein A2U01_0088411, partial [Trifolium medium]|nr:hypothetical protein [Trifolium medium]